MPKNTPKMVFFEFSKKSSSLMCLFFGSKRYITIVLTILQKQHVGEKSGSQVMPKNALDQSDCRIEYLWNHMTYQPDFLHVKSYQLWLEVDQGISYFHNDLAIVLIFCKQVKIHKSFKLIAIFWVGVARYALSISK